MSGWSTIEELLELDQQNVLASKVWLDRLDPALRDALRTASGLFDTIGRAFGQEATDDADQAILSEAHSAFSTPSLEALSSLVYDGGDQKLDKPQRRIVARTRAALDRAWSRRVRGMLLLMCHRSYVWSATDILRRRLTPSLGELRFEVEAAALALMVSEKAALARKWVNVRTFKDGRRFFGRTQNRVRKILASNELGIVYESSSAFAEHARFASIVGSVRLWTEEKDGRGISRVAIGFVEGEELDEPSLLLRVLHLARTQERVLRLLLSALPEVTDPIIREQRLPRLKASIDGFFEKFQRSYPQFVEKAREWVT